MTVSRLDVRNISRNERMVFNGQVIRRPKDYVGSGSGDGDHSRKHERDESPRGNRSDKGVRGAEGAVERCREGNQNAHHEPERRVQELVALHGVGWMGVGVCVRMRAGGDWLYASVVVYKGGWVRSTTSYLCVFT